MGINHGKLGKVLSSLAIILLWSIPVFAAPNSEGHNELNPIVLIGIAFVLLIGKVGGEIFERARQPAVLGELVAGVIFGSLSLVGLNGIEPLKTDSIIAALAQIGVIILLFEVGLETNLKEMKEVGLSSLLVAITGVVVPFFLGWAVARYFLPDESSLAHIFVGATLCATSIGITARVLRDIGKVKLRESRIILGAAVIDDVLGLLILAVISGAIQGAATGESISASSIAIIATKAFAFLLAAMVAGHFVVPYLFKGVGRFKTGGIMLAFSIGFCFTLAWLAAIVGLAPIIGAFAAGLVLDEVHFKPFERSGETSLEELLRPLSTILVPIFFVLMGLRLDLRAFARPDIIVFAIVLTAAAIIGKQACSLSVAERGLNRLAIGVGMVPRGEVGLIFAGVGTGLTLPNIHGTNEPVINTATFGAIVVMVIITTLATPPVLKWALSKNRQTRQK